jgi:hypothetical protein
MFKTFVSLLSGHASYNFTVNSEEYDVIGDVLGQQISL